MFVDANDHDWIQLNLHQSLSETNWNELRTTACHVIWYLRNMIMHTDDFIMPIDIVQNIKQRVQNYQVNMIMIHTMKEKSLFV